MKLPIIIMLALMPLVLTAYAEAPPSHVDVYDYPFNITLLEGGNFTLYNNGTANINMVSHGWFDAVALAGGSVTVDLPVERFFADTYYVQDVMNDSMSTITIVKPTPVYVEPTLPTLPTLPTPEVVVPVEVVPDVTGVHTWCNSPCSDDSPIITFNNTSNVATTPAVNFGATSNATIGTYTSGIDSKVSELEEEIKLLKVERDEWKDLAKALMKLLNI